MTRKKPDLEKVLILGAHGQLGKALHKLLGPMNAIAANRTQADFSQPSQALAYLQSVRPTVVFNAAAFTQVDLAEKETDLARIVNAETPGLLARWCAKEGIPFIHFSTDYVFSGKGITPWSETDPTDPLNAYGKTKAEGEQAVM